MGRRVGLEREQFARCFGVNLAKARNAADVSQDELAFRTSTHRTAISQIERGPSSPHRPRGDDSGGNQDRSRRGERWPCRSCSRDPRLDARSSDQSQRPQQPTPLPNSPRPPLARAHLLSRCLEADPGILRPRRPSPRVPPQLRHPPPRGWRQRCRPGRDRRAPSRDHAGALHPPCWWSFSAGARNDRIGARSRQARSGSPSQDVSPGSGDLLVLRVGPTEVSQDPGAPCLVRYRLLELIPPPHFVALAVLQDALVMEAADDDRGCHADLFRQHRDVRKTDLL